MHNLLLTLLLLARALRGEPARVRFEELNNPLTLLLKEYGADVYSADHDFKRFPGIRHINPLSGL